MKPSLSYRSEKDRCYGATGMAIGTVVMDGEEYIAQISLDSAPESILEYTGDFYFSGNPSMSARHSWNLLLRNYNLSMIATLSNALCRIVVLEDMPVRYEVKQLLHDVISSEGKDVCSLEEDEIDRLFNKNYNYLLQVFNHSGVKSVAHEFADILMKRRRMSRLEILEQLKALRLI